MSLAYNIKSGHCNGTRHLVKIIGQYWFVLHNFDSKPGDTNHFLILTFIPMEYGGKALPFTLKKIAVSNQNIIYFNNQRSTTKICN